MPVSLHSVLTFIPLFLRIVSNCSISPIINSLVFSLKIRFILLKFYNFILPTGGKIHTPKLEEKIVILHDFIFN